ncbi:hypothetical protein H0H81_005083 [Sphagnurus paluster]|uniref:DNA polymerase delta subunit 3 n=1 Tax=Sphagnurus paluster TaxID=117069 RepID=A0A9P7K555_9AGAR|nr:hypothetical protein H0H81_005083 [Sphagnurus paluster]
MGFLKRIFSIGSKKNKKQRPQIIHNVDAGLRAIEEEEHEAAVGRLLRSSSTRFTVVSEAEYSSLPPLPHPINDVIQTPAASSVSIASSTISQRGTYHVTVHKRTQHTVSEFPNANRDLHDKPAAQPGTDQQPNDSCRLLELRAHPSVASLLEMYDEHGQLPAQAFSNNSPSPEKTERPQTRRTGSTLRQLLGEPPSLNSRTGNSVEGDISWAERFLGEADSLASAASSIELLTPSTPNTRFDSQSPHHNDPNDISFVTDHDLSINTYENPAISSMEVELSMAGSLRSTEYAPKDRNPYPSTDPATPQRASQVFEFLTERRRFKHVQDQDRSLPDLPSTFSVSSDEGSPTASNTYEGRSHFSDDSFDMTIGQPAIRIPALDALNDNFPDSCAGPTTSPAIDISLDTSYLHSSQMPSCPNAQPANVAETLWEAPKRRTTVNAPSRVIVTAPTPSGKHNTPSRIPRGPRAQSRRLAATQSKVRRASTLTERVSNSTATRSPDLYTPVPPKRKSHQRTSSNTSSSKRSSLRNMEISQPSRLEQGVSRRASGSRTILTELNKENSSELTVKSNIPSTPMRSKSDSKALFRAIITPSMFRPPPGVIPSPASSSDLSPVGKQLMMNVRQQRSKAREAERQRSGGRHGPNLHREEYSMFTSALGESSADNALKVTYRSLSRELKIHVNAAKNELAVYHDNAPYQSQTCFATYLLCGEVTPGDSDLDVDHDIGTDVKGEHEDDGDEVPQTKFLLVNERDLDDAQGQFTHLDSIHIYSLSPSPLPDAGLICTPTVNVRAADRGKEGKEMVKIVGKIFVQPVLKMKPRHPVAGPSRLKGADDATTKANEGERKNAELAKEQGKIKTEKPKEKLKATGKLDFSKAKPKEKKMPEAAVDKPKEKKMFFTAAPETKVERKENKSKKSDPVKKLQEEDESTSSSDTKGKQRTETLEPPTRGKKRKPVSSDSEDETTPPPEPNQASKPPSRAKQNVRLQKLTVLSDDEDEAPQPVRKPRASRAAKAVDSDTENVQALMDIDDDQVDRVTRGGAARGKEKAAQEDEEETDGPVEEEPMEEDMDMLDEPAPKPKPKKVKKVIPVGKNGLKKKRVVKSRNTVDDKGYTIFEDYSEYESVDENEEPEPAPAKGKGKGKAKAKAPAKAPKAKSDDEEDSPEPAPAAPAPAPKTKQAIKATKTAAKVAKAKQNTLANFFTKPKN